MGDRWIIIPNWDRFQHYRNRDPAWIKVYPELLHKDEYLDLTATQRALLHGLWMEYAKSARKVPENTAKLSRQLNLRVTKRTLQALETAGFIEFALAPRYQPASPEKEKEKETPKPPYRERTKPSPNGTVCPHCGVTKQGPRSLAEHIANVHYELAQEEP